MSDPQATRDRPRGYVQEIRNGAGGYFGVCVRCGCRWSVDRTTRAEAEQDVQRHSCGAGR